LTTESSIQEKHFYWAEENFIKDVEPLGNLLGRLSNKQYKKSEKLPKTCQLYPVTHHHLLPPPQNDLRIHHSRSGSFKNIGRNVATSTYIHVRIPFNFITVLDTKTRIAKVYHKLLDQHKEPFKSITKSVREVSLATIEGSVEDFRDIIKALPQKSEISIPG
jgi:hypothetical protein